MVHLDFVLVPLTFSVRSVSAIGGKFSLEPWLDSIGTKWPPIHGDSRKCSTGLGCERGPGDWRKRQRERLKACGARSWVKHMDVRLNSPGLNTLPWARHSPVSQLPHFSLCIRPDESKQDIKTVCMKCGWFDPFHKPGPCVLNEQEAPGMGADRLGSHVNPDRIKKWDGLHTETVNVSQKT